MKLLITLDFPPDIGGIQKYLYGIVRFCYNENDLVYVAGIRCSINRRPKVKPAVKYFLSPLDFVNRKTALLVLAFSYLSLCKRNRGQLTVECGNLYAAFIPWLLFRITNQPYKVYTYGSELIALKRKKIKNYLLKKILTKAEKLYTLGHFSEKLLRELRVPQPIDIVPPRITLPSLSGTNKKGINDIITILSVGRLVKHKGHENLIRAALELNKMGNFNFIIAGTGPEYNSLLKLCGRLNVQNGVTIKQDLSDEHLHEEYCIADIFVLPSLKTSKDIEGFGIVLLEAMAYHLPIVASASGGIPEVLDNGNCGMLVTPGDIKELVYSIRYLSNNSQYVQNLTKKAYKHLVSNYVWK